MVIFGVACPRRHRLPIWQARASEGGAVREWEGQARPGATHPRAGARAQGLHARRGVCLHVEAPVQAAEGGQRVAEVARDAARVRRLRDGHLHEALDGLAR